MQEKKKDIYQDNFDEREKLIPLSTFSKDCICQHPLVNGIHISGGRGGVLLVKNTYNQCFVFKLDNAGKIDTYFATIIGETLSFSSHLAQNIVLSVEDPDVKKMISSIGPSLLEIGNLTSEEIKNRYGINDMSSLIKLQCCLWSLQKGGGDFICTEYIPGLSFDFGSYKLLFEQKDNNNNAELKQLYFTNLGIITTFDIFINNGDRIPLVWTNEGNTGNFIMSFANQALHIYGIDQQLNLLIKKESRNKYYSIVYNSLLELFSLSSSQFNDINKHKISATKRLIDFFRFWMQYDITFEDICIFRTSIFNSINTILNFFSSKDINDIVNKWIANVHSSFPHGVPQHADVSELFPISDTSEYFRGILNIFERIQLANNALYS